MRRTVWRWSGAVLGCGLAVLMISSELLAQNQSNAPTKRADLSAEIAEAKAVLANPKVQAALKYVDDPASQKETIEQWVALVNTYSPTGSEIYKARHIAKLFKIYGLEEVRIDTANNVIGVRPGTGGGPTIVLNAHTDAVSLWPADQPINAFVADGRVWGPAANDDIMGVQQIITVLRAMNAANIQTEGDVWFVGVTGEEQGSPGVQRFVQANKHLLDWKKGAIFAQLHGGAGEGVSTGIYPNREMVHLSLYTPSDLFRWKPHSVQALARVVDRIYNEVYDKRTGELRDHDREGAGAQTKPAPLFMNLGILSSNPIYNGSVPHSWVSIDLRSPDSQRIVDAENQMRKIAEEVCAQLGPGHRYTLEVVQRKWGRDIEGFDRANSRAAKIAAAASAALYNTQPIIDPDTGCGDCLRAYEGGVPAMSFRGSIREEGGKVVPQVRQLRSETRRRTSGHDVSESGEIAAIWPGIKHSLLFIAAYSGLADAPATSAARSKGRE